MDFRLKAFVSVAQHLNFTKAAAALHISQPAVSKHIQELEGNYGIQLFDRSGGKITLTPAGALFLKHAQRILDDFKILHDEMNLLTGHFDGELKIGASTTIAQYILPGMLAKFSEAFPAVHLTLTTGNSQQIEQDLIEHRIDLGLLEGSDRRQGIRYLPFIKDELVLVTAANTPVDEQEVSSAQLLTIPLVLRENGSGTLQIIEKGLQTKGLRISDLNILMQIGSTEGIKSFLINRPGSFAIASIAALTHELLENRLKVIDISDLEWVRYLVFALPQGGQNELVLRLIRYLEYLNKQ